MKKLRVYMKKIIGGGGSEIVGVPPPPPPHVFLNGIALIMSCNPYAEPKKHILNVHLNVFCSMGSYCVINPFS